MIARHRTAIAILACIIAAAMAPAEGALFWPIDRPKHVTGVFGEYRGNRFHHGMDVGCRRKKGYRVYAADDGTVSSVMYQHYGIGFAVFIRHKNGTMTRYGHLDRFGAIITRNKRVQARHADILNKRDFEIKFDRSDISVKRGQIIGYSGDTGMGPEHLHFELRDKNGSPLNPLRHGIQVPDNSPPIVTEIHLVPLDGSSHIDGYSSEARFKARLIDKKRNMYSIDARHVPVVAGRIGIKVTAYDRINSLNRVALYGIESYVNDIRTYRIAFSKINPALSRRMGLYYDYDHTTYTKFTYYLYSRIDDKGVIDTARFSRCIDVKALCFDAGDNISTAAFRLSIGTPLAKPEYIFRPNLNPGKGLALASTDKLFTIDFPAPAALYPEMVDIQTTPAFDSKTSGLTVLSPVYAVLPSALYLDSPATVSFAYSGSDRSRVGIYTIPPGRRTYVFHGNTYDAKSGRFTAPSLKLGRFFLIRDDVPPVIKFAKNGKRIRPGSVLHIPISDKGSGVNLHRIAVTVDGAETLWSYEPDRRYIEIFGHNPIWKKGRHTIDVRIFDRAGNSAEKRFYYTI